MNADYKQALDLMKKANEDGLVIARVQALAGAAIRTADPRAVVAAAIEGKTAVASNAPYLTECGITTLRRPSGKAVWDLFATGYGPTRSIAATLDADRRRQLQADFAAFHDAHRTELGVAMPREYLVTVGVRK